MSVQERPDELIRLLRPEFAGRSGADSPASLTWGKIMLIPPAGAPVTTYPVTVAGLLAALAAATVAGSMIWVPPGSFNTAITIPANIALVALGEKVSINGQWTLNSGVVLANIVQTQSGSSAGALSGVVGPSSGIAYMKNCSINVENSGAGDAYAVNQNAAGDLWLWGCATYGNASGGGSGYGVRQSAGTLHVSDDGRHRGSTGKFSGTVQLFSFDDVIKLKTSTFTKLFNATDAGVTAVLAAATSGDVARLPDRCNISGGPWTNPAGVEIVGAGENSVLTGDLTNNGTIERIKVVGNVVNNGKSRLCFVDASSGTGWTQSAADAETWRLEIQGNAGANYGAYITDGWMAYTAVFVGSGSGATVGLYANGANLVIINSRAAGVLGAQIENAAIVDGFHVRGGLKHTTGTAHVANAFFINENYPAAGAYDLEVTAAGLELTNTRYRHAASVGIDLITYGQGDRGAYEPEEYHAKDIEDDVLTRHLPAPTGDPADDGKTVVIGDDGTFWEIGEVPGSLEISIDDVSNPPTEAQLITAFGAPDTFASDKKIGVLNDNALGINTYAVYSDGGHFWLIPLAKASVASLGVAVASTTTIVPTAGGQWFGRASLERLADGTWVLCYREGSAHDVNDGELHIRFSDDQAATWTAEDTDLDGNAVSGFPMNPSTLSAGEDAGEPWLYLAPNGTLILHMWRVDYGVTANGTYQSTSTDGGKTWSASAQIDFSGIADDAKVFATDDHFVLNGVIYAGARVYDDAVPTNTKSILIKSTDNGTTWEYVSDISSFTTDTTEVGFEYVGNNRIVAILRDLTNTVTYKSVSTDLGATWSALEDITSTFEAAARIRIQTRAHLKGSANWWQDSVLIAYGFELTTPGSSHPRRNAIWISQDRGETWNGPYYADVEINDAGYGDMLYDSNNGQFVFISYQGTTAEASIKQYNLTITGI